MHMIVRDDAAFDVHDMLRKSTLAHHRDSDRGEGFIDFAALDVALIHGDDSLKSWSYGLLLSNP
jgi:hypothetical protein